MSSANREVTSVPYMNGSAPNCSGNWVPCLREWERPTEFVPRWAGCGIEFDYEKRGEKQDGRCEREVLRDVLVSSPVRSLTEDAGPLDGL